MLEAVAKPIRASAIARTRTGSTLFDRVFLTRTAPLILAAITALSGLRV
jgi:hypothetical protein